MQTALDLIRQNAHFAPPIVFALGFAESIALVSLFVPSSVLFVAIGGVHGAAGGAFWPVCLAGAAGACLGDVLSYALGRFFQDDVVKVWPFSRWPAWLGRSAEIFARWGFLAIVGGKFLGFLRPFIPVIAGTLRMPWPLFLLGSAISSVLWAAAFLAPGYGISLLLR